MKSQWQLKREAAERQERNLRFAICALIIVGVLILQAVAHGLPVNLEEIALSPGALGRLQGVTDAGR